MCKGTTNIGYMQEKCRKFCQTLRIFKKMRTFAAILKLGILC